MRSSSATFALVGALVAGALAVDASPLASQRLFRRTEPLEVTLTADLRPLTRERDSLKLRKYGALLEVRDGTDSVQRIPVALRARGHFRRQSRNCDFPPLRLDVAKKDAARTVLQGNPRLKLTTTCRPGNKEYEQYVLAEYGVYRAWQLVSDVAFRTRLARITYRDSTGKTAPFTTWGFFIEDFDEVADEQGWVVERAQGALFADVDSARIVRTSLFEWLIGNTDWSVSAQHNVALFRDSTMTIHPIPYDFDWSGAVNARYASPDPRLRVKTVTDRLHRGVCLTPAQWAPTVQQFRSRAAAIDSVYRSIPGLDDGYRDRILRFWADGWKVLDDPKGVQRALSSECQKLGN